MTNPSKQKGTAFEGRCRNFLRQWWPVERLALSGSQDRGDLTGIPGVVVEAKASRKFTLSSWMDELSKEKKNANMDVGFVVIKRPNYGISRSYCVMELSDMVALLLRKDLSARSEEHTSELQS